jgi:hypothetical protein
LKLECNHTSQMGWKYDYVAVIFMRRAKWFMLRMLNTV